MLAENPSDNHCYACADAEIHCDNLPFGMSALYCAEVRDTIYKDSIQDCPYNPAKSLERLKEQATAQIPEQPKLRRQLVPNLAWLQRIHLNRLPHLSLSR